ncbi:hypothetical protein MAP00_002740 [Monascus purpureus]|nr:hypothetical protein MAP00_002740 [Monascus purpureus]
MDFWQEIIEPDTVPTVEPVKSQYNTAWLVGSTIVQEFHVMIQEGLEYSYLTNGLVDMQLWVPHDDLSTLYYDLGDPILGRPPLSTSHHHPQRGLLSPPAVECPHERPLAACHHPTSTSKRILWILSADDLVKKLKAQLDQDLDHNCTPIGPCGSYGAPFKITCATFGYTVVGKGTTSRLWTEVSREAEVYRVLQCVQGSAAPVFLGAINLAQIYFLHSAGKIRHMLLKGWGGESMSHITLDKTIHRAISRLMKEIRSLGISHQDLCLENILWNAELKQALIIDFHQYKLDRQPMHKRPGPLKRLRRGPEECESKRLRVV